MVNYGILGFGLLAVKRLMPGFDLAKNSRVFALSRRDAAKAAASARQFGIRHAYSSAEELCRSAAVDAIFVSTPNASHVDDVLLALECGKPVLCEKPMGMNAEECLLMVESARQRNLPLGVAHVFRFDHSITRLREKVAAGEIGQPVFARSEFSFVAGPTHPRTWINDPAVAGGGPIADVGVHCIDTLRYILQDEVLRVSAIAQTGRGGLESAATLMLEFSRGTLGSVLVSFRAEYRTPLELIGEAGVLRADNALNVEKPIQIELLREGAPLETETVTNYDAYARQVDAFADAVEGNAPFAINGEEGWRNQQILDAAYRSIKSGRAEEVRSVG